MPLERDARIARADEVASARVPVRRHVDGRLQSMAMQAGQASCSSIARRGMAVQAWRCEGGPWVGGIPTTPSSSLPFISIFIVRLWHVGVDGVRQFSLLQETGPGGSLVDTAAACVLGEWGCTPHVMPKHVARYAAQVVAASEGEPVRRHVHPGVCKAWPCRQEGPPAVALHATAWQCKHGVVGGALGWGASPRHHHHPSPPSPSSSCECGTWGWMACDSLVSCRRQASEAA